MKNFFHTAIFFLAFIHFGHSHDTKSVIPTSKNKFERYLNFQFQSLIGINKIIYGYTSVRGFCKSRFL